MAYKSFWIKTGLNVHIFFATPYRTDTGTLLQGLSLKNIMFVQNCVGFSRFTRLKAKP
jgi:hypothetical protein